MSWCSWSEVNEVDTLAGDAFGASGGPAAPVSDQHCRQPEHDKDDDREVQQKDGICKSLIGHGGCVCDA